MEWTGPPAGEQTAWADACPMLDATAAQLAPWLANTALLIGALLPPVSLMGFVCLAALVLRRGIQP